MQVQAGLLKSFFVLHDLNFHKSNQVRFHLLPQLLVFLKVVQALQLTLLDYIFLLRVDARQLLRKAQFCRNFQLQNRLQVLNFQDFRQYKSLSKFQHFAYFQKLHFVGLENPYHEYGNVNQ